MSEHEYNADFLVMIDKLKTTHTSSIIIHNLPKALDTAAGEIWR